MKQIKTLLAALFVAMAGTASAQTNYVHITLNDNSVVHYSQDDIKSMIIDTEEPAEELEFVTFTDGTNTVTVANMNLGATSVAKSPETCYGDYYAWGATETFGTVDQSTGTVTATKTGGYTQANAPAPANFADVVTAKMGTGYRMPTRDDFKTLYAACGGTGTSKTPSSISSGAAYAQGIYWVAGATSAVTIGDDTYSVNGMLFVQDADHHVFFPAAGFVSGTSLSFAGDISYSWSSSLNTGYTSYAYDLYFGSNIVRPGYDSNRCYGFTVRPFKD